MLTTRFGLAGAVLIAAIFAVSATAYPYLPPIIPIHWNVRGVADGFAPKAIGAFLMPVVMLLVYGLFLSLPAFCAKVLEHRESREAVDSLGFSTSAFLAGVQALILAAGFGHPISMARTMPVLLGGLFLAISGPLTQFPRNPWFGVRTPWTLASDTVWKRTHVLGSKLFRLAGLASIAAGLVGLELCVTLAFLLAAALAPALYSYAIYRPETK